MFLPVFVHPGKRGPSPVKKSPEKSTAKGGPPTPPPAWPLLPVSTVFPLPPLDPSSPPPQPGQSNACLSLHSLSLHVKKISTSSPGTAARRSARAHQRFFHAYAWTRYCFTRMYTHTCVYTDTRGRLPPLCMCMRVCILSSKGERETKRSKEKEVKRWLHHAGVVNVYMQRCRWTWTRRDTYARVETVVRAERRTWPRCFRVCNLDSQWFHILLPLEPIHKWANNASHSSDRYKRVFGTLSRAPEHTRVFSARAGTGRNEEMGKEKGNGGRGIERERRERGRSVTVDCRNTIADRDERKSERDKNMCVWMCVWGGQAKREGSMRKRRPPTEGQRERVGGWKRGGYPPVWIASSMHRRIGFPCDSSWQSRSSSLANEKLLPCLHPVTRKVWHGSPKLILSRDD